MKRAALALVLAACSTSSKDFPPLPEGSGPGGTTGTSGSGGTVGDAGIGDGGDAGNLISRRVCIVSDLRTPTVCDTTKDASGVKVTLGTQTPVSPPARTGEFTIVQPLDTDLVWHVSGGAFVTSVVPFSSEVTIPIVPDALYNELRDLNSVAILSEDQGSVLARAVIGTSPVAGVLATSTLAANPTRGPLYPDPNSRDGSIWRDTGSTLGNGAIWFPGVEVTTTPAQITFTRQGGGSVSTRVNVEDQAITFIIKDVQ